jgi:peptidoglycan/LPS O-acetylase OafA/YrhL
VGVEGLTPPRARRLDVQGLRAVAVLMVIAYHAGVPLPGGFVGVDIFFVISGFVITLMLLAEHARTGRLRLGQFYLRRFRRLTPALALMVLVTTAASVLLLAPFGTQQVAAKTGVGAMLLVANVVIARSTGGYFDAPAETNPLLHTWSLSVEEQFYLVFPGLLLFGWFLARRTTRRTWVLVALVGGLSLVSVGAMLLGPDALPRLPELLGFYSPVVRAWEFGAGALLALVVDRISWRAAWAAEVTAVAGGAALVASGVLISAATRFPGPWTLLPVAGTVLLVAAGTGASPVLTRLLASRPSAQVGDWSYSLYLWHWPCLVFAALLRPDDAPVRALAVALAVGLAVASYRFVEQPLRARRREGWPLVRMVAVTLALPLAMSVLLGLGARQGWGIHRVQETQAAGASGHVGYVDCMTLATSGGPPAANPDACDFGGGDAQGRIVLVGDSNAAQYSEAVLGAGRSLGRPVEITTAAACPFADVYRGYADGSRDAGDEACRAYYDTTMARLADAPPSVVVIAESASQWLLEDRSFGATPDDGVSRVPDRARVLRAGFDRTIARLHEDGHRVVMVLPMYWFGDVSRPPTLASCPTLLGIVRDDCPRPLPVARLSAGQRAVRAQVSDVARRAGAVPLDLLDRQCPRGVCTAYVGSMPMYADTGHISAQLSAAMWPDFAGAVRRADP